MLAGAVAAGQRRRVYDAVLLKVLGARAADVFGFSGSMGCSGSPPRGSGVLGSFGAWCSGSTGGRLGFRPDTLVALVLAIALALALLLGFWVVAGAGRQGGALSAQRVIGTYQGISQSSRRKTGPDAA